jgi:hypothetical protein
VWAGVVLTLLTAAAVYLLLRWARTGRNADVANDAVEHTQTPAVLDVPVPPTVVTSSGAQDDEGEADDDLRRTEVLGDG